MPPYWGLFMPLFQFDNITPSGSGILAFKEILFLLTKLIFKVTHLLTYSLRTFRVFDLIIEKRIKINNNIYYNYYI